MVSTGTLTLPQQYILFYAQTVQHLYHGHPINCMKLIFFSHILCNPFPDLLDCNMQYQDGPALPSSMNQQTLRASSMKSSNMCTN